MSSPTVRVGRILDAELHLLDRQVLDRTGTPVTAVDDLELSDIPLGAELDGVEAPVVENLLAGTVLGTRLFGRRTPDARWHRIPWAAVARLEVAIHLDADADDFDVRRAERWVRDHIIGRIPGGDMILGDLLGAEVRDADGGARRPGDRRALPPRGLSHAGARPARRAHREPQGCRLVPGL